MYEDENISLKRNLFYVFYWIFLKRKISYFLNIKYCYTYIKYYYYKLNTAGCKWYERHKNKKKVFEHKKRSLRLLYKCLKLSIKINYMVLQLFTIKQLFTKVI